jgi:hypothetical protein
MRKCIKEGQAGQPLIAGVYIAFDVLIPVWRPRDHPAHISRFSNPFSWLAGVAASGFVLNLSSSIDIWPNIKLGDVRLSDDTETGVYSNEIGQVRILKSQKRSNQEDFQLPYFFGVISERNLTS